MYGTLPYERARAIKLVEDIGYNNGQLQIGGEQYPNALSVIDCSESLRTAIERTPNIPDREKKTCIFLADILERVWKSGMLEDREGGVAMEDLQNAAMDVLSAMPPLFTG